MAELTELLGRARGGDREASDRLFALVYRDLHRIAEQQLRGGGALGTTSLVHEAWMKLARPEALGQVDRGHFFAVAARAMRQLAIDHARERAAGKRGSGVEPLPLQEIAVADPDGLRGADLLALDQALERLASLDAGLAQLVELRFFGGLELEEIAPLMDRSTTSLKRDWRRARAYLHAQLAERPSPGGGP